MKICVTGWYYDRDFLTILKKISTMFDTTIVSHELFKPVQFRNGIKHVSIDNIGLEWGAYDFYLRNMWDEQSDVLFMHDDMKLASADVMNDIALLKHDCTYIFRDIAEEKANGGKHGRMVKCSGRFLEFIKNFKCDCNWIKSKKDQHNPKVSLPAMKPHYGFWYDQFNHGHVSGKPPEGTRHYNSAIEHFHWTLGRIRDQRCGPKESWPNPAIKMDVVNRAFFDEVIPGRRNCWKHVEREIKRWGTKRQ